MRSSGDARGCLELPGVALEEPRRLALHFRKLLGGQERLDREEVLLASLAQRGDGQARQDALEVVGRRLAPRQRFHEKEPQLHGRRRLLAMFKPHESLVLEQQLQNGSLNEGKSDHTECSAQHREPNKPTNARTDLANVEPSSQSYECHSTSPDLYRKPILPWEQRVPGPESVSDPSRPPPAIFSGCYNFQSDTRANTSPNSRRERPNCIFQRPPQGEQRPNQLLPKPPRVERERNRVRPVLRRQYHNIPHRQEGRIEPRARRCLCHFSRFCAQTSFRRTRTRARET